VLKWIALITLLSWTTIIITEIMATTTVRGLLLLMP
jgi:hypothetical protein